MTHYRLATALCFALMTTGTARAGDGLGIRGELQRDLAQARQEIRTDLARERRVLDTENLRLDGSRIIGQRGNANSALPAAEITPVGDFLLAGKPQPLTITQRRHLLAHRGLVIEIAKAGLDIGERTAAVALEAVDKPVLSLMVSAMTGGLQRKVQHIVQQQVEPAVLALCKQLPAVMASEQRLAASLPAFSPYATTRVEDVRSCTHDARQAFASL